MIVKEKQYKNPIPTVDTIIERDSQILLVKRKNEPYQGHFALPGGFVDEGETVEAAAMREVKEETSINIKLVAILGVYSDPGRDPRGHIMSTVFIGQILPDAKTLEVAGDDAMELKWVSLDDLNNESIGFDHKKILSDYKKWKQQNCGTFWSSRE